MTRSNAPHPTAQACAARAPAFHPTAQACAAGAPVLRMFLVVALCAAAPLVAATPDPSSAAPQVFRAHSDLVVLHVNVFDGRSDAVPNLPQDAFTVLEDGKPQQISFFNSADVPVSVGLVLDNSGSMIARRKMVVAGGVAFAEGKPPGRPALRRHLQRERAVRFAAVRRVHEKSGDGPRRALALSTGRQDRAP